jgi:hypothetical protein
MMDVVVVARFILLSFIFIISIFYSKLTSLILITLSGTRGDERTAQSICRERNSFRDL